MERIEYLPDELRLLPVVLIQRLRILTGSKEREKALIHGESLVELGPDIPGIRFYLACIYSQQGKMDLADQTVEKCIDLDPEFKLLLVESALMDAYWKTK